MKLCHLYVIQIIMSNLNSSWSAREVRYERNYCRKEETGLAENRAM